MPGLERRRQRGNLVRAEQAVGDQFAAADMGRAEKAARRRSVDTRRGEIGLAGAQALAALEPAARVALLQPADVLLSAWPEVRLPDDDAGRFLCGLRRRVALADAPSVRVYAQTPRAFLGTAHITAGELIADRLLSPIEVQETP